MKTVSLELAKSLKEKGYPQGGHFWWDFNGIEDIWILVCEMELPSDYIQDSNFYAPTADEILDLLPDYVQFEEHSLPFKLKIHKELEEYQIVYARHRRIITEKLDYQERGRCFADSLADAAAKMWLYLKENDLLGVK